VLFLVLGFATLEVVKATTCRPDGTLVVIEGTWEDGGNGYDYCKGKKDDCDVTAKKSDLNGSNFVILSGTLQIEKTQNGPLYHFDATKPGPDTVKTCCGDCQ